MSDEIPERVVLAVAKVIASSWDEGSWENVCLDDYSRDLCLEYAREAIRAESEARAER